MKNIYIKNKKLKSNIKNILSNRHGYIKPSRVQEKQIKAKTWTNHYFPVGGGSYYHIKGKVLKQSSIRLVLKTKLSKEACLLSILNSR